MKVLYTNGSSTEWGSELENKTEERFSAVLASLTKRIDCNNASSGVSNDYIYRQTMRDMSHWLDTKEIWSEESGWVQSNDIFVIIGWTAPTRLEWWDGQKYIQERLWAGYDKWGDPDEHRTTEDEFVLHQTEVIPSYIRTLNHVIGLSSFLEVNKIPYYFFNVFYEYENIPEPTNKIDVFGRKKHQISLKSLLKRTPNSFRSQTMYNYIKENGGKFLPRKHPDKASHKLWAEFLLKEVGCT
jgi:hypothetical protein